MCVPSITNPHSCLSVRFHHGGKMESADYSRQVKTVTVFIAANTSRCLLTSVEGMKSTDDSLLDIYTLRFPSFNSYSPSPRGLPARPTDNKPVRRGSRGIWIQRWRRNYVFSRGIWRLTWAAHRLSDRWFVTALAKWKSPRQLIRSYQGRFKRATFSFHLSLRGRPSKDFTEVPRPACQLKVKPNGGGNKLLSQITLMLKI